MATITPARKDSVTGLPTKEEFLGRLTHWNASAQTGKRYTFIQIRFHDVHGCTHYGAADTTIRELLLYRAANRLEHSYTTDQLIARTSANSLILAHYSNIGHSRQIAPRIKRCLGALGGLLEDPSQLRIKTLTVHPGTLSAHEIVERLDQDYLRRQRAIEQYERPTAGE